MVKELAQVIDDFGPCDEDLPHTVIDDQVQVPLPESCFLHQPIRTPYTLHFAYYHSHYGSHMQP